MAIGVLPNTHLEAGTTSFGVQLTSTLAICGWSFVTMLALFSIFKAIGILRVTEAEEKKDLDISEHGMQAYGSARTVMASAGLILALVRKCVGPPPPGTRALT